MSHICVKEIKAEFFFSYNFSIFDYLMLINLFEKNRAILFHFLCIFKNLKKATLLPNTSKLCLHWKAHKVWLIFKFFVFGKNECAFFICQAKSNYLYLYFIAKNNKKFKLIKTQFIQISLLFFFWLWGSLELLQKILIKIKKKNIPQIKIAHFLK